MSPPLPTRPLSIRWRWWLPLMRRTVVQAGRTRPLYRFPLRRISTGQPLSAPRRVPGETEAQYAQRLLGLVENLSSPVFVEGSSGSFKYHPQPFVFGAMELQGLKIFLRSALGAVDGSQHAGNCASCHLPPNFTDFRFHNNGSSQEEYDAANGTGAFMSLPIPTQAERIQNPIFTCRRWRITRMLQSGSGIQRLREIQFMRI